MAREHLNTEENRELLALAIEARAVYWDASRALEKALGLDEENRELLALAIEARAAYWDARRKLEKALGLDDVPDQLNNDMDDAIATYAVGVYAPTSRNHYLREPEVRRYVLDLGRREDVDSE